MFYSIPVEVIGRMPLTSVFQDQYENEWGGNNNLFFSQQSAFTC